MPGSVHAGMHASGPCMCIPRVQAYVHACKKYFPSYDALSMLGNNSVHWTPSTSEVQTAFDAGSPNNSVQMRNSS